MIWVRMLTCARNLIGEKVTVKAIRRGFQLPIWTDPDHAERTIFPPLQPGSEFVFSEVKLSTSQTRICGHIPDYGWVNLASAFNADGAYRPVWYIAWQTSEASSGKRRNKGKGKGKGHGKSYKPERS